MAKIANQNIVIQISKAVKDSDSDTITVLDVDTVIQLEAVIAELVGDESAVIEVMSDAA